MLERIKLVRFRGFASLDAQLARTTVLLGPNSSGKTSVLHAVRLAIEALDLALDQEDSHQLDSEKVRVCRDLIVEDFPRLLAVDEWTEVFEGGSVSEGDSLEVQLQFGGTADVSSVDVAIHYGRNRQPKLSVNVACPKALQDPGIKALPKKSPSRPKRLSDEIRRRAPRALLVPAFYGVTRTEEHRSQGLMSRLLVGGEQSRVVRNLVVRLSPQRFAGLNAFLRRSVGAELVSRTQGDDIEQHVHLKVRFRDSNGDLELASAGAGLINLVALYSALAFFRDSSPKDCSIIYLLDEPEAHLHPRLQGDVGEAMASLVREFDAQLLMATHSIEIANRVGKLPDALLLAVDRIGGTAAPLASESELVTELSRWCDLTPFTSINFLASRRVLFHEGPSDGSILESCARVYFRNRPADLSQFSRWTLVCLNGVGNVSAQAVLGTVLTPKVFPTLNDKALARAVCVLDRDSEREPGGRDLAKLSKAHFRAYERVWSRYCIESLFLDPPCLVGWLRLHLPSEAVSDADLRSWAEEAARLADLDEQLKDGAEDGLRKTLLRPGAVKLQDAVDEARRRSRQEPQVWQPGKLRAAFILRNVRGRLAPKFQNKVRGSVTDLVDLPADSVHLGDLQALVPQDIRELLEWLVKE